MRFAICNETFQGWSWSETCRFAREVGYDGLEVAPFTLAEDVRSLDAAARTELRRVADQHGLPIVGLHWLLVSPPGLSLTAPDAALRRSTAGYLVALADLCADLGGAVMVLGSPNQRRIPPDGGADLAAERFMETLRPALDRAAEREVVICLEPLPAAEADFLLTLQDAADLMARLDHPAARTIFDVKSACAESPDAASLIPRHAARIAHVHANDSSRRAPGFGDTDFRPLFAALREAGYTGWVSVEPFDYAPDPATVAQRALEYMRSCL